MKELISTIQSLLVKVEEGNISQAEMEQLVADARELNERLIVLRYKVYEQGIFEVQPTPSQAIEVEIPEIELNLEINEEPEIEKFTKQDQKIGTEELEYDDALSEALNIAMEDLSKEELESIVEGSQTAPDLTSEEFVNMNLFSSDDKPEEPTLDLLNEEELEDDEQVIQESTIVTSTFNEESNSETQEIKHHQTSIIESEEKTTIIETEETTKITVIENQDAENEKLNVNELFESSVSQVSTESSEKESKLKSIEQSIRINYSIVPLDTLIGSFTLNERLQFINELFEGSSDSFSSAVKKLDVLDGLDAARKVVAEFASTYSWDLESEIVEDFLVKICRRYA